VSDQRIIGGMFALDPAPPPRATPPSFLDGNVLLLTARCGIHLLIERLRPGQVWMPSYLCGVMLEAVDRRRSGLRFFPVNCDLRAEDLAWVADVRPGDLVVLIDYFGFHGERACAEAVRRRGARVVEDACQALLSAHVGQGADYVLFSPRKFLGVPDGGILVSRAEPDLSDAALERPPGAWWLKAVAAGVLRREFDRHGGARPWFPLFQEIERSYPIGPYAMSELAEALLRHGFDYEAIAGARRANYRVLAEELGDLAVFRELPEDVVPLGFPIRHAERDRLRQALFRAEIYPPVHWETRGCVPEEFAESHRLAAQIMTLPCDQRYDAEDMRRMTKCLRAALEKRRA
jgi:dTDP-4-amino-4,6-dideoxygalactose transaminase